MSGADTYRDALSAAHARIAELEREHASAESPGATRLAALHRERARAIASLDGNPELASLFRWKIYVPLAIAAVAFALDGAFVVALLAPVLGVVVTLVARVVVRANRDATRREIELLDRAIAEASRTSSTPSA